MIWYFNDQARHKAEREAIEALAASVDWVQPKGWRFDKQFKRAFDFVIVAAGQAFSLSLQYPNSFPNSPPSVFPADGTARLSSHQYGPGGELCLEYRADNWTPDIMGYQLIESAFRLLSAEVPGPRENGAVVSAHRTTLGQDFRNEIRRLVILPLVQEKIFTLPLGQATTGRAILLRRDISNVYVLDTIESNGQPIKDPNVPDSLSAEGSDLTVALQQLREEDSFPSETSKADFLKACTEIGLPKDAELYVIAKDKCLKAFRVFDDTVVVVAALSLTHPQQRLSADHAGLADKKVGIIGCGSLGSKTAVSLARSGVGHFILVDDDLMLPDNLVRHELDWRDIGLNKADAISSKIKRVNINAEVRTRRTKIGGQETAHYADDVLFSLGQCNLVVDATANPIVQNVLSGILAADKTTLIWGEVFAGGIGGLIARCRPGKEPALPWMRRQIENWFAEKAAEPVRGSIDYGQSETVAPMTADDTDVSVISSILTRMALDFLLDRDPSHFQYSAYAIGLAPASVFEQALDIRPIKFESFAEDDVATVKLSTEDAAAETALIIADIMKLADEVTHQQKDDELPQE